MSIPNFEQNNPKSPDYIKNRPFYHIKEYEAVGDIMTAMSLPSFETILIQNDQDFFNSLEDTFSPIELNAFVNAGPDKSPWYEIGAITIGYQFDEKWLHFEKDENTVIVACNRIENDMRYNTIMALDRNTKGVKFSIAIQSERKDGTPVNRIDEFVFGDEYLEIPDKAKELSAIMFTITIYQLQEELKTLDPKFVDLSNYVTREEMERKIEQIKHMIVSNQTFDVEE